MHLRLQRSIVANGAVLGVLTGLPKTLYVLEDEWRNNKSRESCIPAGTYEVVPHGWEPNSRVKFPQTWRLLAVPGRSAILIHSGNTHSNTEGCLLVGLGLQISQTQSMVNDSQLARDYMRKVIGQTGFTLTIE